MLLQLHDQAARVCTLHFGAFNVKTGEAVQAPCHLPLRTYKVAVRDGQVYIDLDKAAGE